MTRLMPKCPARFAGSHRTSTASRLLCRALLLVVALATPAASQTTEQLKRLTIEQLMDLEITTLSRVAEATRLSPASVFVITREDIRRSGATSIPEALRLAPGMQVARIDAARWSIGVRGFADRLARSMLVMIDGRVVYSPLFAGTYWEVQDLVLEDIDRIEIIRGPGGTLWGANAVNGIINIITLHARDTQGMHVGATLDGDGTRIAHVQFGGQLGAGHARAYVKAVDREALAGDALGAYDHQRGVRAGFRGDWAAGAAGTFMLSGEAYGLRLGQRATLARYSPPYSETVLRSAPLSGANVLARWTRPIGQHTDVQLRTYYDRTTRDEVPVSEARDTFDLDYQQIHRRWSRHTLVWGLGYRTSSGRITTTGLTSFTPSTRVESLVTGFVQDEFTLLPARLRLTLGTKLQHDRYSGADLQPSARLIWTPTPRQSVSWSLTRAVRTPSRVETDYTTTSLNNPVTPSFVRLLPNPDFAPEELVAHELGYRLQPTPRLYVTAAGFYNQLSHVLSTELLTPFVETDATGAPLRILPVMFRNGLRGRSYGSELTADARPTAWSRITANYSYLRVFAFRYPGSTDVSQERRYENGSPRHQVQIGLSIELPHGWDADWHYRYVSRLLSPAVGAYGTSDLRIAWSPARMLELAVIGRDLHQARHLEWTGVEIRRSVLASLTWRP